jgi:hypothetical protein
MITDYDLARFAVRDMNIRNSYIHSMCFAAFSMMLMMLITPISMAEVFPIDPFNGLQLSYSVSGATLGTPIDSEGFTFSRSVSGTLAGDELSVSGVATAMNGWGATIGVSVRVDGEEAKTFHEEKFPEGGLMPDPMSQPFTVTVPIPADAESASFSIRLAGSFNAGSRGVVVEGTLDRSASPSDPQDGYKGVEAGIPDPRFKPKPSKDLKLYKILRLYEQKIPKGSTSSGNKNNLLYCLHEGSKIGTTYIWDDLTNPYDQFTCGGYQSKVLDLLNSLKFSDDPEERALLDEWDYGPIESLWGGHQAVVIYPKGTDWVDSGIVLDPWIDQEPKKYDIHSWAGMFSPEGSFYGIGESGRYKEPRFPTHGGDYFDLRDVGPSQAEDEWLKENYDSEQRKEINRILPTPNQKRIWIKTKMEEEKRNGRAIGFSPVNLYLEDDDGKITGFPGGVPTWEIEEITMRRFPLGDGTYWTELEYPQNRSYYLMAEGTDDEKADIFLIYGTGVSEARSAYRYQMDVSSGETFAALPDYRGGILYSSSSGSISPEEIETIDPSWLDLKPDIASPPEYELDIEEDADFTIGEIAGELASDQATDAEGDAGSDPLYLPQRDFAFEKWGAYSYTESSGRTYFAAYMQEPTEGMDSSALPLLWNESLDKSLIDRGLASEVLIDQEEEGTIATGMPLNLSEGYQLHILSTDYEGKNAYLQLTRYGEVVDSIILSPRYDAPMSKATYCYRTDLGSAKDIVVIAVHFKNVFAALDRDFGTYDGIFQISSSPVSYHQLD